MTVSSTNNQNRYQGNGVTTVFAFSGRIYSASDIKVDIITRATDALVETLTLTSHYTVTINGPESASVTITSAPKIPSSLQDILIRRQLQKTQTVDLPTGTRFPAVSVENALDKVTTLVQDLSENLERAVQIPITSTATVPGIGSLTDDEVVLYDGTNFITNGTTTEDIQNAASNAAAAASSASSAAAQATLAQDWATKVNGAVSGGEYSSKAWAVGGTGTTTNNAKYWSDQAAAYAASVNLPALGAADTVLQVNAGGTALEYGKVAAANADVASQAEAEAGTDTTKLMTPQRTAQAIATLTVSSGLVHIRTKTAASDATIDFVNGADGVVLDGTYKSYLILARFVTPSTSGDELRMRTSSNAGSSWDSGATDYDYVNYGRQRQTTTTDTSNGGDYQDPYISLSGGNSTYNVGSSSGAHISFDLEFVDPTSTKQFVADFKGRGIASNGFITGWEAQVKRNAQADVDGIRFFFSTGNIGSGTFSLYGINS